MTLPSSIRATSATQLDKVVVVEGSSSIQVNTINTGSCGAYMALPVDAFGTEYVVSTWAPRADRNPPEESFYGVIAPEADTTLTITTLGVTRTETIAQAFGSFSVTSQTDLSGTVISADKPIGVLSGNPDTQLLDTNSATDYLISYLWPTQYWGSQHVVPAIPGVTAPYSIKITASVFTEVRIYGDSYFAVQAGGFVLKTMSSNRAYYIESSAAIQVVQYAPQEVTAASFSAPASIIIPSVARYASDVFFTTPQQTGTFTHYVTVTIAREHVTGLLLDTQPLQVPDVDDIPRIDENTDLVTITFTVSASPHYWLQHAPTISLTCARVPVCTEFS